MSIGHDTGATQALFREAMSRFPSGVTLVTTVDADGRPRGFTATAFTAVSMAPPLVLTCLDRTADCHPAFLATRAFAVNILGVQHRALACRFASKGVDKFAGASFTDTALGSPGLVDAVATVDCETAQLIEAGDHTILLGLVRHVRLGEAPPVVYAHRGFREMTERHDPLGPL
ncbi:flavin reductase family protein [Mycobacterium sp. SM1]|uniref:flavin reductase family protein n=1 Tax=Mycobacterium sp. SM1 TaxID=2816243 RepID=UPI001BCC0774|nr:flavin reductase family protein [Mycobacterium sp. SM1]MBS4729016.1 flavin reductase family protein [Mycobacterium sp. SM1]